MSEQYLLTALNAAGEIHPHYPPAEWPDRDPLSITRPIILQRTHLLERGGAKERKLTLKSSLNIAEEKGRPIAIHLPEGVTEIRVTTPRGYQSRYAIDAPDGDTVFLTITEAVALRCTLPELAGLQIGASVCPDPHSIGWRYIWWWDPLPLADPNDEFQFVARTLVAWAREENLLPGTQWEAYHILGSNLRPGFARLLEPRIKPHRPERAKTKGRRR